MAEENQTPEGQEAAATEGQQGPQFSVQKIYLKDVSFESPGAPNIFKDNGQPELKMNLTQRVLTVTVTCKIGEKTAYLAEVQQAGIFGIVGFEQEQLQATLGAYCPTVLFPYARQQISDMVANRRTYVARVPAWIPVVR